MVLRAKVYVYWLTLVETFTDKNVFYKWSVSQEISLRSCVPLTQYEYSADHLLLLLFRINRFWKDLRPR